MRPFHPPRPNAGQPHRPRPGDPAPPPLPMHPGFNPPPVPNLAAANPMAAAAAANPFLAMQLFGQAQQLQSLGFLAAAALQQHHHQPQPQAPFFPGGGFPPNPNQFGAFPVQHAGFNGGGAFRPGGVGVGVAGPRTPRPMMGAPGNGYNSGGGSGHGTGAGAPRPMLNGGGNDRNSSAGKGGEVNHTKIKPDGIPRFTSENGERKNTTDQKARFNSGRDCRDSRQFGPSGGRGRGRGRSFNQGRGGGNNNWRDAKSNFRSSDSPSPASGQRRNDSPASGGHRKRPRIIYDANEVKQWLEARKKNYPTSVNINKTIREASSTDHLMQKLSESRPDGEKKDEEAQMRRQELKEVLEKQKELGFELPELPPGYLSEHEDQGNGRRSNWKTQRRDCRFGNRADNKRSSDYPDKPLEFPSVKVNQIELESNIAEEDLDDLMNSETAKDSILDLKENGDQKDSSSIDGESDLDDDNDDEDEEDDDDGNGQC
ncbi:hypothetical protein OsJ_03849 [Oryza sativa Japonica Group]|uniref:FMR1-interacting protein 1 conserved domain-containing protein n=1 Tax=Oryza sativa subsp. japonica TaxID=39947 RepID=B9ETV3_ORYSJ|nr:hypothetical protein OsJ_03849 [Oryza sativa Japonica Group]